MKLFQWATDNFDTALAIVLSTIAAVFGTFGIFQSALLPALAGTLALLAVSIIRDRNARDLLTTEIQKLEKELGLMQTRPSADTFFSTKTSETIFIPRAREAIWIVQETGSKLIEENLKPLELLIRRGGNIRIILANNTPQVNDFISRRNKNLDAAGIVSRHNHANLEINSLCSAIKGASGHLEIKYLDYPLDITAVFIDPESANTTHREGLIRMVGFKNFFEDKRDFTITYRSEPETYEYFVYQFREMWKLSKESNNL